MTTAIDILNAARDLISDEARWTKGKAARKADFTETWAKSPEATCWCVEGAVSKVTDYFTSSEEKLQALGIMESLLPGDFASIPEMNDHDDTTHEDVLSLFDRAILKLAKGE